jgi:hypothetical protein
LSSFKNYKEKRWNGFEVLKKLLEYVLEVTALLARVNGFYRTK